MGEAKCSGGCLFEWLSNLASKALAGTSVMSRMAELRLYRVTKMREENFVTVRN
jgi:hypothetical protein